MTNPNPNSKVEDEEHSLAAEEPLEGRCNNQLENGEFCMRFPALSEDGKPVYSEAQCYFCAGGEDGNTSATHGLYSRRSEFYKRLDPYEQGKIDELILDMINKSPYGEEDKVAMEEIRRIGVDIAKVWYGNKYLADKGMAMEAVAGVDDQGHPIHEDVENIMNIPIDRLQRSITDRMKTYGIIAEDPESKKAESIKTLAEVLSENGN